jgi:hypothetical protein
MRGVTAGNVIATSLLQQHASWQNKQHTSSSIVAAAAAAARQGRHMSADIAK